MMIEAFEWPTTISSLYDDEYGGEGKEDDNMDSGSSGRRSLFRHTWWNGHVRV
jgi:hypothetical protein